MHGKIMIDDLVANLEDIEVKIIDFKDCKLIPMKLKLTPVIILF